MFRSYIYKKVAMKKLLNKITDMPAEAALLEMGVEVQPTAERLSKAASAPGISPLNKLLQNLTDTFADAAMFERGVTAVTGVAKLRTTRETLEENLIEVAFAEEADYDDIHNAILREHESERGLAHPDDNPYGDSEMCFV